MQDANNDTPPHRIQEIVEPLERLEALLIIMLSSDLSAVAPVSRHNALSLAYSLVCGALDAAKQPRIPD